MICFRPIRELLDRDNAAVWSMLTPLRSAVNQVRRFPTLEPPPSIYPYYGIVPPTFTLSSAVTGYVTCLNCHTIKWSQEQCERWRCGPSVKVNGISGSMIPDPFVPFFTD